MTDLVTYLAAKLRNDGYSGLCSEDCGCDLSSLLPCDMFARECQPGYRHECNRCPRNSDLENNCPVEDGGVGMCVGSTKDWPGARDD